MNVLNVMMIIKINFFYLVFICLMSNRFEVLLTFLEYDA